MSADAFQARRPIVSSSGQDKERVTELLASKALGSYIRNRSLIRLERDTSFWKADNEPTVHRLAVFLHEYLHFVHNFSTISGVYDFVVQLRLGRIYVNATDGSGRCKGEPSLSTTSLDEVRGILAWRRHLRGEALPPAPSILKVAGTVPKFDRWQPEPFDVELQSQRIQGTSVKVVFDVSSLPVGIKEVEFRLGTTVLTECCAFEAEALVFEKFGLSSAELRGRVSSYPYLVGRAIFEALSLRQPSSRFLCRICVLALQSTDPGHAFIDLALACASSNAPAGEECLMAWLLAQGTPFIEPIARNILGKALALELAPFLPRGRSGAGLSVMGDWCRALLERRLQEPFFELDAIGFAPDTSALIELLKSLPTCPVLHEIDAGQDDMLFFSESQDADLPKNIGAAQALLSLIDAHFLKGRLSSTEELYRHECSFRGVCKAQLASASPDICEFRPWEAYQPGQRELCWFASAVSDSRGLPTP